MPPVNQPNSTFLGLHRIARSAAVLAFYFIYVTTAETHAQTCFDLFRCIGFVDDIQEQASERHSFLKGHFSERENFFQMYALPAQRGATGTNSYIQSLIIKD